MLLGLCKSTKNVPLTEGISWWLTKTISCLNTSASPQGSTSCMIHGYWSLHHTHRPLLNATERYFVWPLTQASRSLASCGQGLFITSLSGGQLSQTPMVLGCSSVMGSWRYVWFMRMMDCWDFTNTLFPSLLFVYQRWLFSHPGIPGWLYVFVPVRTPPPAPEPLPPATDFCSGNNIWTTFRFISFLAQLLALTNRLPD